MSLSHEYQQLESGAWADRDPNHCACRGFGWLRSDLDTLHRCPLHGKGVPHPEDDRQHPRWSMERHLLQMMRVAYKDYQKRSNMSTSDFRAQVLEDAEAGFGLPEDAVERAREILKFARMVATEAEEEALDAAARLQGYSCALEARMAEEVIWERKQEETSRWN